MLQHCCFWFYPYFPPFFLRWVLIFGSVNGTGSSRRGEWLGLFGEHPTTTTTTREEEIGGRRPQNQNLEEENYKGLSLDPLGNHHHHHHQYIFQQNQLTSSRDVTAAEDDGDEGKDHHHHPQPPHSFHHHQQPPHQDEDFHTQFYLQQQHHLYGQLEAAERTAAALNTQHPQLLQHQPPPATTTNNKRSFSNTTTEHAATKMEDSSHHHRSATTSSRLALRNAGPGEIVEVQGGHIVRSTGRKDRHSKVCTAKGPRDRRVRLSAHTAIQFYDVQDRLGYDRPSKAVDWLIKKAKPAIDELAELPAWKPTITTVAAAAAGTSNAGKSPDEESGGGGAQGGSSADLAAEERGGGGMYMGTHHHHQHQLQQHQGGVCNPGGGAADNSSSLLPPSLDSDAIADTIKSFFPMGGHTHEVTTTTTTSTSPPPRPHHNPHQIQFPNYPPDLLSRTSSQSQDLRLSLQSFQDPIMLQSHHHHHHHSQNEQQHSLFPGATAASLGFENPSTGWAENQHQPEMGRFQRLVGWNNHPNNTAHDNVVVGSGGGGFMFSNQQQQGSNNNNPPPPFFQSLFGHSGQTQFFSTQRGPLQSSNTPMVRAWISDDPGNSNDHHHHQATAMPLIHPHSLSGFASGANSSGFSGFRIPARIQGEEEHDGNLNKPSSASSASRH